MWVFVIKATLEMNQHLSKQTLIQIHLTMLPNKRIRFRTRAKPADNAMFAEEFFCKVSPGQFFKIEIYILKKKNFIYQNQFNHKVFVFDYIQMNVLNVKNFLLKQQ